MAGTVRRSFAITFRDTIDPEAAACLHELDAMTARLRSLMEDGRCTFYDTITEEVEPVNTVIYRTVFSYFKRVGNNGNMSSYAAGVMQTLFDMRGPSIERVVRFYCAEYHHAAGACACPSVTWPVRSGIQRLRYRSLCEVRIARRWLMDRADLLALTDEQLDALDIHHKTRERVINFITWLRNNPDAR